MAQKRGSDRNWAADKNTLKDRNWAATRETKQPPKKDDNARLSRRSD